MLFKAIRNANNLHKMLFILPFPIIHTSLIIKKLDPKPQTRNVLEVYKHWIWLVQKKVISDNFPLQSTAETGSRTQSWFMNQSFNFVNQLNWFILKDVTQKKASFMYWTICNSRMLKTQNWIFHKLEFEWNWPHPTGSWNGMTGGVKWITIQCI